MAKSAADKVREISAPSLMPQSEIIPPPEREEEVVPALNDLIDDRKVKLATARDIDTYGNLGLKISPLKKQQEDLKPNIKNVLGKYKIGKAISSEWRVSYSGSTSQSIKREKLIESLATNGIPGPLIKKILEESTVTASRYTLRIGRVGVADEGDE